MSITGIPATAEVVDLTIKEVRRAVENDIPSIKKLFFSFTEEYFGEINLPKLLERCFISLCVINTKNKVVGIICLDHSPNVPAIPASDWLTWIRHIYNAYEYTPHNSLFVHLLAWSSDYRQKFLEPLLRTVFVENLFIQYTIMVVPHGKKPFRYITTYFKSTLTKHSDKIIQYLLVAERSHFVAKSKIRRAVEEDNDDIVPLIHSHSKKLKETYGEFYISEIIAQQKDKRHLIVSEYKEYTSGVMCLSADINYEDLNEFFELSPYYGLRKMDERDTVFNISHDNTLSEFSALDPKEGYTLSDINLIPSDESPLETVTTSSSSSDYTLVGVSSSFLLGVDVKKEETYKSKAAISALLDEEYLKKIKQAVYDTDFYRLGNDDYPKELPELPIYYGESNATCIELCACRPEWEVETKTELIKAAFQCYPDNDYIIFTLPSLSSHFPLLNYFHRVPPRPYNVFPHELHVLHRNAILSYIEVRHATKDDYNEIENLVYFVYNSTSILRELEITFKKSGSLYSSYVMCSEEKIVGVAVIRRKCEHDTYSAQYHVEEFISKEHYRKDEHALLVYVALSPIFQKHARFFLREIIRLSDTCVLYYLLTWKNYSIHRNLVSVLTELIPAKPRIQSEYRLDKNKYPSLPKGTGTLMEPPAALYFITSRYCNLPKKKINCRMIIVGASDTAFAFLESLMFGDRSTEITFSNITLVSAFAIPGELPEVHEVHTTFFPFHGRYTRRFLKLMGLQTYVSIVHGAVSSIDRKKKLIVINNKTILSYDLLFLMCGQQFPKPNIPNVHPVDETAPPDNDNPDNLFIINSESDASFALTTLKQLVAEWKQTRTSQDTRQVEYTIIIYGDCIEALCCVTALREFGVLPENIKFVTPSDLENVFNNPDITAAVKTVLESEVSEVYYNEVLVEWKHYFQIYSVTFQSKFHRVEMECQAFFCYCNKKVNTNTFLAINHEGLVYDENLVINNECRTNDEWIYAAGPMTKYSRRYYADHMAHRYYNSVEIGTKLGDYIRNLFDSATPIPLPPKPSHLIPGYTKPLITSCTLPGGINYLYIRKPGPPVPLISAMNYDEYGRVIKTGNLKNFAHGYFRIQLNNNNIVETITCLTKHKIDVQNMIKLYGKHEQLLNNLMLRYKLEMIVDLYEFFKEPWTCAIFHDKFDKLQESNMNKYLSRDTHENYTFIRAIIHKFHENSWKQLMSDQKSELLELYTESEEKAEIENSLLKFIIKHTYSLPVYELPKFEN